MLDASGTAANPIVVRGASRDGTILDGAGCDCNVLEVYGSFVHVEQLTLRNANRALRFQTAGAEGNVVRRVHTLATRLGFGSREDQLDFYICDNLLEGLLVWPHVYFDDDGTHSNDDGIHVEGHGHVVCHNQLVGFGDALKTEQEGARAVDFYGNEVLSAYDNGIELDYGEGNLRCLRNRFTNNFLPINFQPVQGGPAYAMRNVAVNIAHEQLKFHGVGGGTGPSGVLVYQNTFVSPATPLQLETDATSHYFEIANNLFVGPADVPDKVADWLGPIDNGRFDYDGYFPERRLSLQSAARGAHDLPELCRAAGRRHGDGWCLAGRADLRQRPRSSPRLHVHAPADRRHARPDERRGGCRSRVGKRERRFHGQRSGHRRARTRLSAPDLRHPPVRRRRVERAARLRAVTRPCDHTSALYSALYALPPSLRLGT